MIDWGNLRAHLNIWNDSQLRKVYRLWIEEALAKGSRTRQPEWTESIAVGVLLNWTSGRDALQFDGLIVV